MTERDIYKKVTDDMIIGLDDIKKNTMSDTVAYNSRKKAGRRSVAACILVSTGILGVTSVGAAYAIHNWSEGLKKTMQVNDTMAEKLEKEGYADFPDDLGKVESVTVGGVTLEVKQSIVDNYFGHIVLSVKGLNIPENEIPSFDNISVTVDGIKHSYDSAFTALNEYGEEPCYRLKDGSLEYHIVMKADWNKGVFFGKPVHVELENMRFPDGNTEDIEGKWAFEWILNGSNISVTKSVNIPLDTGLIIKEIEYSPISTRTVYYSENGIFEDEETDYIQYFHGVKLKDGRYIMTGHGGGQGGLKDEEGKYSEQFLANEVIVDMDEIDSLLYLRDHSSENEDEWTYYEVKVND